MSISGVRVSDEAIKAFEDLKLGRKIQFVIFGLNDAKTEIITLKTSASKEYEDFLAELPENDCRYAAYEFNYELPNGEGKRDKMVFFTWSPDTAPIRSKMIYASSRESLTRALSGVHASIQGTDFSEVAYETVLERVSRGAGSH